MSSDPPMDRTMYSKIRVSLPGDPCDLPGAPVWGDLPGYPLGDPCETLNDH